MKKLLISLLLMSAFSLEAVSMRKGRLARLPKPADEQVDQALKQPGVGQAKRADSVAQVGQESLSFTYSSAPPTCFGGSDGSAGITVTGGTAPYTVTVNGQTQGPGAGPFNFNNLTVIDATEATFLVSVTDSEVPAVTYTGFITVLQVDQDETPTQIINTSSTAVTCPGSANGNVTLFTNNTLDALTWTLTGQPSMHTPAGTTMVTFTGLAAGTYTATVTDDVTGTCGVTTVVVGAPAPIAITATTISQVIYPTASLGIATLTVTGGTAPYIITFDGQTQAGPGAFVFNNVAAGTYTASVTDISGCTGTAMITISCVRNTGSGNAIADFITTKYCQGGCVYPVPS